MNKIHLFLSVFLALTVTTTVSCTKNKLDNFYQAEFVIPLTTNTDSINLTFDVEEQKVTKPIFHSDQSPKGVFLFDRAIQMGIRGQNSGCRLKATKSQ